MSWQALPAPQGATRSEQLCGLRFRSVQVRTASIPGSTTRPTQRSTCSGGSVSIISSCRARDCSASCRVPAMGLPGFVRQFHHPQLQFGRPAYQNVQQHIVDGLPLRLFQIQSANQKPDGGHSHDSVRDPRCKYQRPENRRSGFLLPGRGSNQRIRAVPRTMAARAASISSFGDGLGRRPLQLPTDGKRAAVSICE